MEWMHLGTAYLCTHLPIHLGLPIFVPTCPKKLFEQGPRKKYVDIVTDTLHASSADLITWNTLVTLHASSADLITWNTLVMMRLKLQDYIPEMWHEITAASLDAWNKRD